MRSSERPATQRLRPVARATSPNVWSRAAFEAKVVTTTRPFAAPTAATRPARRSPSLPDASELKPLVVSPPSTSTPSSPIAVHAAAVAGLTRHGFLVGLPWRGGYVHTKRTGDRTVGP